MTVLNPYPDYKESGADWIGKIPDHWGLIRLKNGFTLQKRPADKSAGIVTAFRDGQVTLRSNRRVDGYTEGDKQIGYQNIHPGDLVIHAMDAFAGAIGVSDSYGQSTPVYSACTPKPGFNVYFYALTLRHMALTGYISSLAKGVRERSTDFRWADAKDLLVASPPLNEQNQIIRFLDRETAQIDELITKQERLIELLAEKRQAVITQAVTKGLDASAPTKPSGTAWLGDIPAHWTAGRIKYLVARIEQGVSPQADSAPAPAGSWGVLKSGCVNGGTFRETENKKLPDDFVIASEYVVHLGDLLVSRASGSPKLVGSAARIRNLSSRLILSDKTFRFTPRPHVNTDFLEWFLNSQPYRKQVVANISGAEGLANNISVSALKNIRIALPPMREQTAIVERVNKSIEKLDTLESAASRAIQLLRERRSALISAAVTGKIDVRGEVA